MTTKPKLVKTPARSERRVARASNKKLKTALDRAVANQALTWAQREYLVTQRDTERLISGHLRDTLTTPSADYLQVLGDYVLTLKKLQFVLDVLTTHGVDNPLVARWGRDVQQQLPAAEATLRDVLAQFDQFVADTAATEGGQ